LLYNLVSNRIAFAQAVFSKSDPIYDAYFKNAPSGQYVDEGEDVYNFYYFYKPAVYKLSFFKNPSEAYGDSQDVFYDMDLDSAIEAFVSIYGEPTPPDGEAVQFGGWAVVPFMTNGDERIDGKGNSMPSYNLNLYAIWEPAQYPVTTKDIDNDNDGNDDVYYAKHNQMLKELPIENPQVEDYFFNGWKLENGRTISGELKITEPTVIVADMVPINTRTITYNINGGTGTLPSDTNKYMVGSKAGIKAGIGLKTDRLDIFNTAYEGTFVSWNTRSDGKGSTYYPGEHMVIPAQKDGESHTITLYAIYSEKRETTLIYDKNAVDARFVEDDDDQADYTPTSGGASILDGTKTSLVLRFRDYKTDNPAIKSAGYPNEPVVIGEDAEKRKFTLVRDGYSFMGWSMSRTATVPDAVNGDMAYVNTLAAGGNTLYAVWAKPLKAYVYVNMGSMKSNTELMDMLGLKYFDSVWAPAGTVDIPATILTGKGDYKDTTDPARTPDLAPEKGKGLITSVSSPDDWKTVSKALSEDLDRTTLSGDDWENGGLYPSANASNIIGNYAYEVDKQYGKNASSGLFYYKSADDRANHYLNKPVNGDEEPVEFHLEVSFMTAKVKYVYGDNGITEAAAPGRDGTEIDTRVYIRNGDVPEPVSLQGLLPENYSIAGYYCDKEFTKEWHPWSDSEEITVDGKTKTVHRILSRQEKTAQRPLTMNGSEYEWTRVGDEEILTVYVKLNHNGYDVYFAKKDGYGELLDGAGFTVYGDSSCTDAGIKMRGTDPVTAVSSGTSVLDSDNVRINGVNILMKKVPSGIWY
ncbi:MAG: hypothetical protein J6Y90_01770, partial [Lachnospiraceae bacterium]|nr:hypothetical protein [Lachnospiraceae bacterium]